jgi:hypothetical protein
MYEREINEAVTSLGPDERKKLLDYAHSLRNRGLPPASPGRAFEKFIGRIPDHELEQMKKAIEEDCERIDPSEW